MTYAPNRTKALADAPIEGSPWERQLAWKESPQAYAGFQIFRDLEGNNRTLKAAADIYAERYNRQPNSAYTRIRQWKLQYRWDERTTAYDNMLDAVEIAGRKRQIVKRTKEHARVMEEAQETLAEPLKVYAERLKEMADGLRNNGLKATRTNSDGDEVEVYSDEQLIALGRASLKTIMDAQRAEREALQIEPSADPSNMKQIERRGVILRRLLEDDEANERVEEVVFKVVETERAENEQTG